MHRLLKFKSVFVVLFFATLASCKSRSYNNSQVKDLSAPASDSMVNICVSVGPVSELGVAPESKAHIRVSCTGQCNGADYRNRKFYLLNDETVGALEFSATTKSGNEFRDLFIFLPKDGILETLKNISIQNQEVLSALRFYGLDPESFTEIRIPSDGKLLLFTGTKASLSTSGLLDGGTLDCGGQPTDGSVELESFKSQNFIAVKKSAVSAK